MEQQKGPTEISTRVADLHLRNYVQQRTGELFDEVASTQKLNLHAFPYKFKPTPVVLEMMRSVVPIEDFVKFGMKPNRGDIDKMLSYSILYKDLEVTFGNYFGVTQLPFSDAQEEKKQAIESIFTPREQQVINKICEKFFALEKKISGMMSAYKDVFLKTEGEQLKALIVTIKDKLNIAEDVSEEKNKQKVVNENGDLQDVEIPFVAKEHVISYISHRVDEILDSQIYSPIFNSRNKFMIQTITDGIFGNPYLTEYFKSRNIDREDIETFAEKGIDTIGGRGGALGAVGAGIIASYRTMLKEQVAEKDRGFLIKFDDHDLVGAVSRKGVSQAGIYLARMWFDKDVVAAINFIRNNNIEEFSDIKSRIDEAEASIRDAVEGFDTTPIKQFIETAKAFERSFNADGFNRLKAISDMRPAPGFNFDPAGTYYYVKLNAFIPGKPFAEGTDANALNVKMDRLMQSFVQKISIDKEEGGVGSDIIWELFTRNGVLYGDTVLTKEEREAVVKDMKASVKILPFVGREIDEEESTFAEFEAVVPETGHTRKREPQFNAPIAQMMGEQQEAAGEQELLPGQKPPAASSEFVPDEGFELKTPKEAKETEEKELAELRQGLEEDEPGEATGGEFEEEEEQEED